MAAMAATNTDAQTQSFDEWSMQLHISDARLQPPLLRLLCWWCDPDAVRHIPLIPDICFLLLHLFCFFASMEKQRGYGP
jgi:hypothetical protein